MFFLAYSFVCTLALAREITSSVPHSKHDVAKCDPGDEVDVSSIPEMQSFQCPVGEIQKPGTKGCSGGNFTFCIAAQKRVIATRNQRHIQEILHLFTVPRGTKDFRIDIEGFEDDVDLYVTDNSTGKYILHAIKGLLHGTTYMMDHSHRYKIVPPQLQIVYKNMKLKYSGDDRTSPVKEHFIVEGEVTTPLDIKVTNWGVDKNAIVKLKYKDHGVTPCDKDLKVSDSCVPLDAKQREEEKKKQEEEEERRKQEEEEKKKKQEEEERKKKQEEEEEKKKQEEEEKKKKQEEEDKKKKQEEEEKKKKQEEEEKKKKQEEEEKKKKQEEEEKKKKQEEEEKKKKQEEEEKKKKKKKKKKPTPAPTPAPTPNPTPLPTAAPTLPPEFKVVSDPEGKACRPLDPKAPLLELHGKSLDHCFTTCLEKPGCSYASYAEKQKYCLGTAVCQDKDMHKNEHFKIWRVAPLPDSSQLIKFIPYVPGSGRRLGAAGEDQEEDAPDKHRKRHHWHSHHAGEKGVKDEKAAHKAPLSNEYCAASGEDLLYHGPSENLKDCQNKCILAPACSFISFAVDKSKSCVMTTSCDGAKVGAKGTKWEVYKLTHQEEGSGSILIFVVLGILLLLCCLLVLILLLFCRPKSDYQPVVDHAAITEAIEKEMGGQPIAFKSFDYHLKPEGEQMLNKVAAVLKRHPPSEDCCIKVLGYTGKPGGKWSNHELCEKLGYKRAVRIMEVLESKGCKHRIVPIGYGNEPGKGGNCEIHACNSREATNILREAQSKGQDPDMIIP